MFIRRKVANGVAYYDLAESYRENGEVKKRILIPLGRCSSVQEAILNTEHWLKRYLANREARARDRNKAEKLRRKLEILRSVVTKASSFQTVNSEYTESVAAP
jgi:hypothetical protein